MVREQILCSVMGWAVVMMILAWSGAVAADTRWDARWSFEDRLRYEHKSNFDLDDGKKDVGDLWYLRTKIGAKMSLLDDAGAETAALFVEGLDAQAWANRLPAPDNQRDDLDLHQGYLSVSHLAGSDWGLRLGRQKLCYGPGRLIAAPSWGNRIRSFDAGVLRYQAAGWWADFLYGQVVVNDDGNFNRSYDDEKLFGVYGQYDLGVRHTKLEGYFLGQRDWRTSGHKKRYTAGLRLFGDLITGIKYDLEVPFQFGEDGGRDIRAYAVHASLSRQWADAALTPRVTLEYNQASGDHDPNDDEVNTFVPLYQTTHGPYGIMDLYRWQNMREVALTTELSLNDRWRLIPQTNVVWLDSDEDAWYSTAGRAVRAIPSGDRDPYLGQEISLVTRYEVNAHLQLEAGVAHFFPGAYVRDSGSADGADWCYTQMLVKF